MERTYTPGYSGAKAVLILFGLSLVVLGLLQLRDPLVTAFTGTRGNAIIVRIEKTRGDQLLDVYITTQSIPRDEDRSVAFWYWLEYLDARGQTRQAKLAAADQIEPKHGVGDAIAICYREGPNPRIYGIYEMNTWTLGALLVISGIIFTGAFVHLFLFARRPIVIPEDTPENVRF